jgi:hypothetical protein
VHPQAGRRLLVRAAFTLAAAWVAIAVLRASPVTSSQDVSHGGVVRGPTDARRVALLFTGTV